MPENKSVMQEIHIILFFYNDAHVCLLFFFLVRCSTKAACIWNVLQLLTVLVNWSNQRTNYNNQLPVVFRTPTWSVPFTSYLTDLGINSDGFSITSKFQISESKFSYCRFIHFKRVFKMCSWWVHTHSTAWSFMSCQMKLTKPDDFSWGVQFSSVSGVTMLMKCSSSHRPCWCAVGTVWSWAPRPHPVRRWPCTGAGTGWVWPGLGCVWACAVPPPRDPRAPHSAPLTRKEKIAPPPELRPPPLPKRWRLQENLQAVREGLVL